MDIRDDPSTTTTTDYDSGDSVDIDYVYEGQKGAERKSTKGRSPKRKRSPRPKPRGLPKCTCGAGRPDDEAEITVFEEDTDTEEERGHRRRSTKPRPSGSGGASGCDAKDHHKRKATESRTRRAQTPYIEDYPDDAPRPAILLREHKILRRSSTSDAKRVRDLEVRSLSSGSRGRSPSGKRLPPRPPRRPSKESSKHAGHRKRRPNLHGAHDNKQSGSDTRDFQSHSGEPGPNTRRLRHGSGTEPVSTVSRSSAWNENPQPKYSSSWPLHAGSHLRQRRLERRDHDYDSEEESDDHHLNNDNDYDEHHRLRHTQAPSFRERESEVEREREREPPHREGPPPEREREPRRAPSRHRPRNIANHASMATMDHGYRSAATSMCEVWRGEAGDWESPYVSASDADLESDIEEPIRLLRMEDLPPRRSSPRLLPPRGERRDFGFQATNRPPPPSHHPLKYTEEPFLGPVPGIYRHQTWANPTRKGFLLDEPLALTMEPDAMTDDEDNVHGLQPLSRASPWLRPGPPRGWTQPLPPRSRAASPAFSARRTREFLSPKPTRAARFDFGAWGCDRASRSSLALGLL
ncbi:hypothetical protein C8A01DRAFT_46977 [Parachaetomium inaequale]|uniref:Uncharacterized protein n=1 Tax=Parachaetomium inaequale TaxID=2588326 RepID=A0AAN6PES0_9PEZI|nr:hypothetical protein C8A01DRAFT_46977 [Parachaetomium inaequale]